MSLCWWYRTFSHTDGVCVPCDESRVLSGVKFIFTGFSLSLSLPVWEREDAGRYVLASVPEDVWSQYAGHVCRGTGGAPVLPAGSGEGLIQTVSELAPESRNVTRVLAVVVQSIPEIPPKPGELRTELRGYRAREEAAAAAAAASQQLKAEQKVD